MENELRQKIESLGGRFGKSTNNPMVNDTGMCIDTEKQIIKFNHLLDEDKAIHLVKDIQNLLAEFNYISKFSISHVDGCLYCYMISYQKER